MPAGSTQHDYTATETLHQGGCTTMYRALRGDDHCSVVLKVLDSRRCRQEDLERLRHEYETAASLDLRAIVRPLALETYQGMPALVFEDCGEQSLDRLLGTPMPVEKFLELAVRIAGAVADLHRQGVIHKDLKPENILVHPATLEVKLADFGLASRLPREHQAPRPPHLIEGSLPFISPEQTGRMNRAIDSRTDLYSLGVTFYQMLTGRLPFEARDPLEWIHCHVARAPTPPSEIVQVPEAIGQIVLKLLAKMADERYQTARGLKLDLERCLAPWRVSRRIIPFPLGERDLPDRLQIPQRLYGRDQERAVLLRALERVVNTGSPELVLVSGYSGIGKSSLVQELQKPLVKERGFFLGGKFDQLARGIPYSTPVKVLTDLVTGLLAEGEPRLRVWREEIQKALGTNGKLITDVIPRLKLLIGDQAAVPELPLTEAERRFHGAFRDFLGVFTRKEHPLVLFLDDLQWADAGSLRLIEDVITHPHTRYLLLIGAYRDNEVDPSHPLTRMLERIRKTPAVVDDVVLSPLGMEHVAELVADTVRSEPARARPLAAIVHEKTGGNPFFVIQFLTTIHREQLLELDEAALTWRWDGAGIQRKGYTDNVADFMARRLTALPAVTQDVVRIAACIGNEGKISLLALTHGRSEEETLGGLWEAIREGLALRSHDSYAFAHDRIQQAAYSLIPESERAALHLQIGRLLLARTPPGELEEKIFETVNQLDRGAALITSREERERVAELNLVAGKRAKASTAYASALQYLAAGGALLSEDRWDRRYDLAFALDLHRAECEYLTGELTAAEGRLAMLARRAAIIIDAAAVACAQVALYTTLDRSDRSVEACLEYLRRLGVHWSPHPAAEEVRQEYERLWRQLGDRSIEELIDLPAMADPEWCATLDVLTWGSSPALFTDENLFCLLVGRMANLSLEHGNSEGSCLGYLRLGMVLGPHFGDYQAGFRFGKLGFDLMEKRDLLRFKARVYVGFGHLVNPWTRHLRGGIELVRRAFDTAQETGDLTYASYACNCLVTLLLADGEPLGDVQREAERALAFVRKVKFGLVADILTGQLRLIRTLRGLTPDFSSFDEAPFDEARFEQHLESDPRLAIATCWYWIRKLQGRFFAGDHAAALEAAAKAQSLLWTSPSFFELAEYHFHAALARAAHHDAASAEERPRHREALVAHLEQLEVWAENCPENFGNRAALLAAELARVDGEAESATRSYEQAIRSARDNGFVQNEALAYEVASRFYRARGLELIADTYLREARACYMRWGADGKVRQLERLHPQLLEPRPLAPTATFAARAEQVDLLSVVKASQTISGEIEVEKLVGTLLQVVLEQGGARRGFLVLARDGGLSIEAEALLEEQGVATRILPSLRVESSPLLPASVVHYARLTREPVILDDAAAGAGMFASDAYFTTHRPRSVLCLPIVRQESLVGLVYLENDLVAGAFTPDRLTALSLLAWQAAISMENALLFERERVARTAAEQAERRSTFLADAGALLSESLDYEETLTRLGRLCVKSLADTCVLDLVEGREIRRVARACADPAKEALLAQLELRHPARWDSPHPASACLRSGEPILASDITEEVLRSGCEDADHAELVRAIGTRSAVIVPLVGRGQTLGAFTMGSSTPGRYGRADLELALEVARRAATAIDNARLYGELQRADHRKTEFLGVMSHELRNPLAPICSSIYLLDRAPPDSPVAARARKVLQRQTQHLTRLVDDLLDVTRITRGKIEIHRARLDLRDVIRSTCDDLRSLFDDAGIDLRLEQPVGPLWVDADATRMAQVAGNLLRNALKFTPAGGNVIVSVTADGGRAEISLRDTGIGMEPGQVERMFEPFAQAEQGLARTEGGLGLGLPLAKELVRLHGGSIRATSEGPGRGSQFVVTLPLSAAETTAS